jgi:hypothetical protein
MSPTIPIIDDLGLSRPFRIAIDCTIFLISLYFLERSADVFVDSAAVIGKRFAVPTVLVGLLTAGAEWEEVSRPGVKECSGKRTRGVQDSEKKSLEQSEIQSCACTEVVKPVREGR